MTIALLGTGLLGSAIGQLLHTSTAAGLDPLDYCALHALTAGRAAAAEPG